MFSCVPPDVPCIIYESIKQSTMNQWTRYVYEYIWEKVARKLAMVEADLERAEERAEQGEKYVISPDLIYIVPVCWKPRLLCLIMKAMLTLPPQPNLN